MHPDPRFRGRGDLTLADALDANPFGSLFVSTADGPMVAHVPMTPSADGALHFHIAKSNRATPHLAGATALFTTLAPDGYISPTWYALDTPQVPTWNYVALEVDGHISALDEQAMLAQIDALARWGEPATTPWLRANTDAAYVARLLRGIAGFALHVTGWRYTEKLSQDKGAAVRERVAAALDQRGGGALATRIRAVTDV